MRVSIAHRHAWHRRPRRGTLPQLRSLLLGVLLLACSPVTVHAQGVPANVPGTLFRTGAPVWIVADPNPPHDISGVYDTQGEADDDPRLGTGFVRYGPFVTPVDAGFARQVFATCMHTRRPYSQWSCPPIRPLIPLDSVVSIRLTINAFGREPTEVTISPDSVDLIFFTLATFDRFLAPYYTSAYGAQYTATLRDSLAAAIGREND